MSEEGDRGRPGQAFDAHPSQGRPDRPEHRLGLRDQAGALGGGRLRRDPGGRGARRLLLRSGKFRRARASPSTRP